MLFNSIQFLLFFIVVTILYFELPHKYRTGLLLAASCYFYMMFRPVYILILGFTIVVDYYSGIYIEKSTGHKRKVFLVCSLLANIGILVFFKYWNFLNENIEGLFSLFSARDPFPFLKILLPIGLSFHTFQAMSYTIEVYRGNQKAERNFWIYSLYVMFYPQLVAGPIERPQNLLHQFKEHHHWDFERFKSGLMMMLWGFFKKCVIADRLSIFVNEKYADIHHQSGSNLLLAAFFFSFQIYCDFSGYSDIAIGSAKVMGFDLMTNFNNPYSAKNISEFWRKWHISLSTWFRDYLYISLGGNRVSIPRWYLNLFIVFLVSGIWHGANWTFVIWGALHGGYMVTQLIIEKYFPKFKLPAAVGVLFTFTLVCFTWIFFRAKNVGDAVLVIRTILDPHTYSAITTSVFNTTELGFSFFLIGVLLFKDNLWPKINTSSNLSFYMLSGAFAIVTYLFGVFNTNSFIYFQF